MLKENQEIQMTWNPRNKDYYMKKGYPFTKMGRKFVVDIEDLPDNSCVDIKVICDYCNEEYVMPYQKYLRILKGQNQKCACKECLGKKFLETSTYFDENRIKIRKEYYEYVVKYCKENQYELLSSENDIKTQQSIIAYKCPIHGLVRMKLESILSNHKCHKCSVLSGLHKRYQNDLSSRQYKLYIKAIHACEEMGYSLVSTMDEIKNNTSKIVYLCPTHGVQSMRISNLINKRSCPECAKIKNRKRNQLDTYEVLRRIENAGGIVDNPEDYMNNSTKNLKIHCPLCGQVFITSLQNFTQHDGQLCDSCSSNESLGESKIRIFLESHNIEFIKEHWFADCRDISPLRFDFYLYTLNTIIEFDGKQHFDNTHFFSHSHLGLIQKHDNIKNQYCKSKSINLIRIPYWDIDRIPNILSDKLIA